MASRLITSTLFLLCFIVVVVVVDEHVVVVVIHDREELVVHLRFAFTASPTSRIPLVHCFPSQEDITSSSFIAEATGEENLTASSE